MAVAATGSSTGLISMSDSPSGVLTAGQDCQNFLGNGPALRLSWELRGKMGTKCVCARVCVCDRERQTNNHGTKKSSQADKQCYFTLETIPVQINIF